MSDRAGGLSLNAPVAPSFELWLDEQTSLFADDPDLRAEKREVLRQVTLAAWDAARAKQFAAAEAMSEIGPRFAARSFGNFRVDGTNARAFEAAQKATLGPQAIGLHGPVGTGKSHLAAAIINVCKARGIPSVFLTSATLISRLRAAVPDTEELVERFARVPVLALDDIGKEQLTKWSAPLFLDLINRRYEQNLPLIVTCNVDAAALREHYARPIPDVDATTGPALVDRLLEMSAFPWLEVCGDSRRWGA